MAEKKKQEELSISSPVMRKLNMVPGKHYEGSAWINEFGEFQFRPAQKGVKPQGMSKLKEGDNWVILTSKNLIKVTITIPRLEVKEICKIFRDAATSALAQLYTHDLSI